MMPSRCTMSPAQPRSGSSRGDDCIVVRWNSSHRCGTHFGHLQFRPGQERIVDAVPRSVEFTMPMDLASVPAICLPCGFSADGLPYSIQFTGRRLAEATLCRIAYAYEQATAWHTRHPALKTA